MKSLPIQHFLKKNWLIVGIVCLIALAGAFPSIGAKGGPLKPEYTVKYGAVAIIFLISGLSLQTDSILETFQQYKLHCFVQCFTFLFIPTFTTVVINIIDNLFKLDSWILKGLLTVACMPPPVSSAVILTKAAQGNETAAIFNSVVGSFLGIIFTPILLLLTLNISTKVPFLNTILQLCSTVLLPLIIGQYIKKFTSFKQYYWPLSSISQSALLFIIYSTFCDAFKLSSDGLTLSDIFTTIFLVLGIKCTLMAISFSLAKYIVFFTANDVVAILFCSTHKSLTLGIPILRIMFGNFPHFSKITLPLLVYHPVQIILGGFFVPSLKDWVNSYSRKRKPPV